MMALDQAMSGTAIKKPNVNLDALIGREDFALEDIGDSQVAEKQLAYKLKLNELEPTNSWYHMLRKPDFQRETTEWKPDRVMKLIKAFVEGDLIPSVILWRHKGLVFVIDGSHRLSALIAWVQDDYGDRARSRELFSDTIDDTQLRLAQKTRALVEKEVGSYAKLQDAVRNSTAYSQEIVRRGRDAAIYTLDLQWVHGSSAKAEESFIRINQQVATISTKELELLQSRKLPATIAARAIWRRTQGHRYWSGFQEERRVKIEALAENVHDLLFIPPTKSPARASDLAVGGPSHAGLEMVYDFVNLCVESPSQETDPDGQRTIAYLTRSQQVMRLITGKHASSLGLHPAVYFYSWTNRHQPIQFITVADFVIRLQQSGRINVFTEHRGAFEDFLVSSRPLLQKVIRAHGSVQSRKKEIVQYYIDLLEQFARGVAPEGIWDQLIDSGNYDYLKKDRQTVFEGAEGEPFSQSVKHGARLSALLKAAHRCPYCKGYVALFQSESIDHGTPRRDGGTNAASNAEVAHPYCNSGYKEHLAAQLARIQRA